MCTMFKVICSSLLFLLCYSAKCQTVHPDPRDPLNWSYAEVTPVQIGILDTDNYISRIYATAKFNLDSIAQVTFYFAQRKKQTDTTWYYERLCAPFSGSFLLTVRPTFQVGDASTAIYQYIRDSLNFNFIYP